MQMVVDNVRLLFLLSAQQGCLYSDLFFAYQMARVEAAHSMLCCRKRLVLETAELRPFPLIWQSALGFTLLLCKPTQEMTYYKFIVCSFV